jgi:hypothetical protein
MAVSRRGMQLNELMKQMPSEWTQQRTALLSPSPGSSNSPPPQGVSVIRRLPCLVYREGDDCRW